MDRIGGRLNRATEGGTELEKETTGTRRERTTFAVANEAMPIFWELNGGRPISTTKTLIEIDSRSKRRPQKAGRNLMEITNDAKKEWLPWQPDRW
jgi:hypothetical protein